MSECRRVAAKTFIDIGAFAVLGLRLLVKDQTRHVLCEMLEGKAELSLRPPTSRLPVNILRMRSQARILPSPSYIPRSSNLTAASS